MRFLAGLIFIFFAIVFVAGMLIRGPDTDFQRPNDASQSEASTSSTPQIVATTTSMKSASTTKATSTVKISAAEPKKVTPKVSEPDPVITPTPDPYAAMRIQDPYPTPPESFATINEKARGALVNILCAPREGGLRPTSGSGVIIDPRGVILTNAHVAQYVLLSQSKNIDLSCTIRTGSPAIARWKAQILYIPPVWVHEHVSEIRSQRAFGTGEHDYALLLITGSTDGQTYSGYPYLPIDTRHAIAFEDDAILVASYPAELIGSFALHSGLYAASSQVVVQKLLTFVVQTVDLVSLGGIIGAQSGSSGGAVVNAWGRLVGLIVTTSAGATTGERDLRALTLSYIDRDLATQTGHNLTSILDSDVASLSADFNEKASPILIQKYIDTLTPSR